MDDKGASKVIIGAGRLWILPVLALLGCSFRAAEPTAYSLGQAQRLSVRVESEAAGGVGLPAAAASPKHYSLQATAALLPLSVSADEVRVRLQLENVKLQAPSEDEQAVLTRLLPVLGEPTVLTLSHGSLRNLQVSTRMQVQAYGWLRAVVSALQWPEKMSVDGLQVEEDDATGFIATVG